MEYFIRVLWSFEEQFFVILDFDFRRQKVLASCALIYTVKCSRRKPVFFFFYPRCH